MNGLRVLNNTDSKRERSRIKKLNVGLNVRHCTYTVLWIWIKIMKTTFSLILNCCKLDWKSFLRLFFLVRLIVCPNLMFDDLVLTSDCSLYYSSWIFAKLVFLLNVPTFYSFKRFGFWIWVVLVAKCWLYQNQILLAYFIVNEVASFRGGLGNRQVLLKQLH